MRTPLKYFGGDHYQAKTILSYAPPHTHYAEPFFGGGSVLLAKDPTGISETVNDINKMLMAFWRTLQIPSEFEQFHRLCDVTPLCDGQFSDAQLDEMLDEATIDDSQYRSPWPIIAWRFFIRNRMSRLGLGKDYATPTTRTRRGMNENVSAWLSAIEGLPEIHARLRTVEIRSMPALQFIKQYDHDNCWMYIDPPYLHETRAVKKAYKYEMTESDHRELLGVLSTLRGKFALAGYPSELYAKAESDFGWRRVTMQIDNKASSKKVKEKVSDCLWLNY